MQNKSVVRSKLIQPAPPLRQQREGYGSNPFANSNHEEHDLPFEMSEDISGFIHIETYHQAPPASSKESLLNSMNIGNKGQLPPGIKAQAHLAKNASVLLSTAPDRRFKCNELEKRPITKKQRKRGDQAAVCGPNGKCLIF